ncbi:hypothetical protein SAY87_011924 [Trapa incisa]|uniref:NB-ARC domain-containing protein n=1 Tax=Trapa incisa TaxID=236973 RepID=A0AAN7JJ59_9MYRT|nr:hypothetical protein SAY87_011924 [Trapa incisa]
MFDIYVHRMGGISKTTLAKAVLDKFSGRFESWKLIENVREECLVQGGLNKLKEKLRRMQGKNVLIVLDYVDEGNQIDELVEEHIGYGAGSVIIVTCREKHILRRCKGVALDQIIHFEMNYMEYENALRLFCKKTFERDTPPHGFENLSGEVVKKTGGLPLSLIVMARSIVTTKEKGRHGRNSERIQRIFLIKMRTKC